MIRFDALEDMGLRFAGMTQLADGDFAGDIGERALPRLLGRLGLGETGPRFLRQVHGDRVVEMDRDTEPGIEADGMVTITPGVPLVVRIADCVPVYLYGPNTGALGLLHAGRIGTEANIAAAGVSEMEERYGAAPTNLTAIVGPSIGPCCYEVSQEMASEWAARGLPQAGRNLDLWEANAHQLQEAGIHPARIEIAGICTRCSGQYHSHRGDPSGRRNVAIAML